MDDSDSDLSLSDSLSEGSMEWTESEHDSDSDFENTPPRRVHRPLVPREGNGVDPATEPDGGTYNDKDPGPESRIPKFDPGRPVGLHLPDDCGVSTRSDLRQYLTPVTFFKLFMCSEMVSQVCLFTNSYAEHLKETRSAAYRYWTDLTPEEFYRFMALLMYMSIVQAPSVELYWSTKQLFHGLWGRAFMSRYRYKQIQTFLKVSNFREEKADDKITKVRFMHEFLRRKCMKFFQPYECVSVDERMVQNKGRYSFRQYIKDKPTKWGMKLWVLADSKTGYTYNFEVYTGKSKDTSANGLGYDVVMKLCRNLFNQGYRLFVDNFYTSVKLFLDLIKVKIFACGTMLTNRKNFPKEFKDTKTFNKNNDRGGMRWKRLENKNIGVVQWKDNKVVNILSTMHKSLSERIFCKRRTKVHETFRSLQVSQPVVVRDYNKYMGGVDRSDQMIGKYKVLRKTTKFWKTLLYHFIDIARVNAFILFKEMRKQHPDIQELKRPRKYTQLDFTVELIRELAAFDHDLAVPLYSKKKSSVDDDHYVVPDISVNSRNCVRCYRMDRVERKSKFNCKICRKHLCCNQNRNCLVAEHPLSNV